MKKLKLYLLILSLSSILLWGISPLHAGNTTVLGDHCITITGLDADWKPSTCGYLPSGYHIDVSRVVFYPSGTSDVMIVHNGGIDADPFFESGYVADEYDARTLTYPKGNYVEPIIDISDCTLDDAAAAIVKIYFR